MALMVVMASSEAMIVAAAPSFKPEEFPAVTLPPSFLKAGRNLANTSLVVFGFTNSSFEKMIEGGQTNECPRVPYNYLDLAPTRLFRNCKETWTLSCAAC